MQASKILPNTIYAVKQKDGELARFQVEAVVTRRINTHNNPHDYESTVEGHVITGGLSNKQYGPLLSLDPKAVLGPYQEYAELVAAQKAAEDIKKAEIAERKRLQLDLVDALYALLGLPTVADGGTRSDPVRADYGDAVEITKDGVPLVLAALKKLEA
jgi:hypothetical protein